MDLIMFDPDMKEIGVVNPTGDFEIGDSTTLNDFELTGNYISIGRGIYAEGTEVGGIIGYAKYKAGSDPVYKGWTWRGLLTQDIIIPPKGSDYRTVSGDTNTIIKNLIANSSMLSYYFEADTSKSGINVSSYQFDLYCTYLDGIMNMLDSVGAKLVITAKKSSDDKKVHVILSAALRTTVSGNYNEDVRLPMTFTDDQTGINHLVCMGSGELQARQRVDLYVESDGTIGTSQYYTGANERTAYYDYGNAESTDDLKTKGIEKLKSLASGNSLQIGAESIDMDIGDIISGHYTGIDDLTGETIDVTVSAPINKKTYKFADDGMTIEYGLKEDK